MGQQQQTESLSPSFVVQQQVTSPSSLSSKNFSLIYNNNFENLLH